VLGMGLERLSLDRRWMCPALLRLTSLAWGPTLLTPTENQRSCAASGTDDSRQRSEVAFAQCWTARNHRFFKLSGQLTKVVSAPARAWLFRLRLTSEGRDYIMRKVTRARNVVRRLKRAGRVGPDLSNLWPKIYLRTVTMRRRA
jgi:hypothetical protein